eukprot:CAMPEP_0194552054 /NCGR_PEP_ID=MMETSP0253-20130528/96532_1 /TAXON_ID=2966 /ORGANISM="Noctiluca scintillans" /LENGTH=56 /DNA_ID=CAMNT_0039399519 /DNA_START=943 /DNA_END=1110 /DNA_ORIENTATION=-
MYRQKAEASGSPPPLQCGDHRRINRQFCPLKLLLSSARFLIIFRVAHATAMKHNRN